MESTEDRIMNAAMRLFVNYGYDGTSTRKIAYEAHVNDTTLFRKFQSKENILKAVIIRNRDDAIQKLDNILIMGENNEELNISICLYNLAESILEFMEDKIDLIILLISEGRKRPEIADALYLIPQMITNRLNDYFKEQIKESNMSNIDPQTAAFIYVSYIFNKSLNRRIFGERTLEGNKETLNDFIEIFTSGILNLE